MQKRVASSFKMNVVRALLFVTFPLISMLLFYSAYSFQTINDKYVATNQQSVNLYAQSMQKDLEEVDTFVSNLAVNDYNYHTLSNTTDPLKAHIASHEIVKQYKTAINSYEIAGAFFIYSASNNTYRDIFSAEYSYEVKESIRRYMRAKTQENQNYYNQGWLSLEVDDQYYLFRILGKGETFAAVMIDFNHIYPDGLMDSDTLIVYGTLDGVPLTNRNLITTNEIDLKGNLSESYVTGSKNNYLAVGRQIDNSAVNLIFLIPQLGVFNQFHGTQAVLLILSILTVLLVPFSFLLLKRSVLSPLERLVVNIGKGSENRTMGEYRIREFKQVDAAFFDMNSQISELKIIAYEHEIERQKAELQYLQLQIQPHFFLNCLKSLFGMAQRQKYEHIQEMILAISHHLRYNFKDNLQLVPLRQEEEHVMNYIRIQQMGLHVPPVCEWTVDPSLLDFEIPPLSIQSFVENAVKYAMKPNKVLQIQVKIVLLQSEDGNYVDITIQDNGDGFEDSILHDLNGSKRTIYAENHVGVTNVRNRLAILYGDKAMLAFFNTPLGALAEIIIPIDSSPSQEEEAQ